MDDVFLRPVPSDTDPDDVRLFDPIQEPPAGGPGTGGFFFLCCCGGSGPCATFDDCCNGAVPAGDMNVTIPAGSIVDADCANCDTIPATYTCSTSVAPPAGFCGFGLSYRCWTYHLPNFATCFHDWPTPPYDDQTCLYDLYVLLDLNCIQTTDVCLTRVTVITLSTDRPNHFKYWRWHDTGQRDCNVSFTLPFSQFGGSGVPFVDCNPCDVPFGPIAAATVAPF